MLNAPNDEISRRRPVWEAMSEFFLDTELDESRLREIAVTLHVSGYTEGQLDEILRTEVAPLLFNNLNPGSIVGVWDAFDLERLEREILAGRHRRIQKWHMVCDRWRCAWVMRGLKEQYWNRVRTFLREKNSSTTA